MASLDSLPADQRAVLQLVLQRGRSYDEIARMLSIDRAAVRDRALAAVHSLGPPTDIDPEPRALITDYLLGQLPAGSSDHVRGRLAENAAERDWARALSSALAELASAPLPEVPSPVSPADGAALGEAASAARAPGDEPSAPASRERDRHAAPSQPRNDHHRGSAVSPEAIVQAAAAVAPVAAGAVEKPPPQGAGDAPTAASARAASARAGKRGRPGPGASGTARRRRRARLGGAILILLGAVVAVVVVILLVTGGSSSKHALTPNTASPTPTGTAAATTAGASGSATTTAPTRIVAQINLAPPRGAGRAKGIADVVTRGRATAIAIEARGLAANSTHPPDAYAVWLYNSPTDSDRLGFVSPGVTSSGTLQTAGPLPANAAHYRRLIITLETLADPKVPGQIVLEGTLTGV